MARDANFRLSARGARAAGSNDLDTLFPDEAPATPLPMAHYNKRRGYDRGAVREALSRPVDQQELVDVDPRELSGSQSGVTRSGVKYYMGDHYSKTGKTYADEYNPGNAHPVVYDRNDGSERILLSGHHRAVAALLKGTPLPARRVQGP